MRYTGVCRLSCRLRRYQRTTSCCQGRAVWLSEVDVYSEDEIMSLPRSLCLKHLTEYPPVTELCDVADDLAYEGDGC